MKITIKLEASILTKYKKALDIINSRGKEYLEKQGEGAVTITELKNWLVGGEDPDLKDTTPEQLATEYLEYIGYKEKRQASSSNSYQIGDTVFSQADPKSPFVIVTFVTNYTQGDIAVVRQVDNLGDPEGGYYRKIWYEVPVSELYDDMNPSLEKEEYYRLTESEIETLESNLIEEEEWQEGMNPSPYSDKDF